MRASIVLQIFWKIYSFWNCNDDTLKKYTLNILCELLVSLLVLTSTSLYAVNLIWHVMLHFGRGICDIVLECLVEVTPNYKLEYLGSSIFHQNTGLKSLRPRAMNAGQQSFVKMGCGLWGLLFLAKLPLQ